MKKNMKKQKYYRIKILKSILILWLSGCVPIIIPGPVQSQDKHPTDHLISDSESSSINLSDFYPTFY
jgi:hypothetical protein